MTIEKITTENLFTSVVPSANRLYKSIIPSIPEVATYRYWRAYKKNGALGGFYHTDVYAQYQSAPITITAAMLSQSGLRGFNAANLVDNNNSTRGFDTDASGIGSFLLIDFGAGNEKALDYFAFYVDGAVTAIWDIEYSADNISFTVAAAGLDCSGGAGLKTITW